MKCYLKIYQANGSLAYSEVAHPGWLQLMGILGSVISTQMKSNRIWNYGCYSFSFSEEFYLGKGLTENASVISVVRNASSQTWNLVRFYHITVVG